jgi:beta-lactam-binding protein with PASTA domain
MTQAAATASITSAGLTLGSVTMQSSATVASGNVISETPTANTMVASGSSVNLIVSSGPAQVSVPNVVGMTQAAASVSITSAGLVVGTVTTAASASIAANDVISQDPAAATTVVSGSPVNLTISSGPPPSQVAVPNVVGLTQSAAVAAINAAGLSFNSFSTGPSTTVPYGTVAAQYPDSGALVAAGTAVNLSVSSGSPSVPAVVPNVVGLTQSAAATAIEVAGVVLGNLTGASSSTVAAGTVISESPAAATNVPPGSPVNLILSTGAPTPSFAYVGNSEGTVSAFARNTTNGALTPLSPATIVAIPSSPNPARLQGLAIDPSGRFLYVSGNYDDNGLTTGGIFAFVINNNGSLSAVPDSPFAVTVGPAAISFDAAGNHIYVANNGDDNVSGFTIDPGTGALTPLQYSPYSTEVAAGTVSLVRVGDTLYADTADNDNNSIVAFTIVAGPETLASQGPEAPFAMYTNPSSLFANPSGSVLFALTQIPPANTSYELLAYDIDSSSGALTPFTNNPLLSTSSDIATLDPSGQFLFLINQSTGVEVHPINALTGTIGSATAGSPFATSPNQSNANPVSVNFDATGKTVYVVNGGVQSLSGGASSGGGIAEFTFDNNSGQLTPVTGSPVTAGDNPVAIAIK